MNSQQLRDRLKSLEDAFHTALTADEIKIGWLKTRVKTIAEIAKRAASCELESGERLDAEAMQQMSNAFGQQLSAIATKYIPDDASRHAMFTTFYEMPYTNWGDDGKEEDSVLVRVRDAINELAASESDDDREILLSQLCEQLSKVVDAINRTLADAVPAYQVAIWKAAMASKFQEAADKYLTDEEQLILECELANL